jgi:hypothetical protein
MSRLYCTERGHVVPTLCEELTRWRRARKQLWLPGTTTPARLYVLARPYPSAPGEGWPLRIAVNGTELPPVAGVRPGDYQWYEVAVPPGVLVAGANAFDLWTDAPAMTGWSLALEPGHAAPQSFVSDDAGGTWRNESMGYLSVLRGEYVVRLRLAEGDDPAPPALTWEDPAAARVRRLREVMPAAALGTAPLLARVRALTGWLSTAWEHTGVAAKTAYTPWDAETILAWGRAGAGHFGQAPIVMCVHYAAAFVSCAQAAGMAARCAPIWGTVNGFDGHFVAEVWSDAHGKWIMVDPNVDAIFTDKGSPLSIAEIQRLGDDVAPFVEWGRGSAFQRQNPRLAGWLDRVYLTGTCFRHRSVWRWGDYLTHPQHAPPGHGWPVYCETGLVWETRDLDRGLGMFPSFGGEAYFNAPPEGAGEQTRSVTGRPRRPAP